MGKKEVVMARFDHRRQVTQYKEDYVSVGKWIRSFILLLIPGINVIAYLVWLFGGGKNNSRTNFIRASLLFTVLTAVALVIIRFMAEMTPMEVIINIRDWFIDIVPFL